MNKYGLIIAGLLYAATQTAFGVDSSAYPKLKDLYRSVTAESSYTEAQLESLFANVELQPRIIEIMERPAESLPWYKYRKIFLTEKNINNGVAFWRQHADVLQRAEREYGVPAEIIVATIGVETRYGSNTGGFKVIEALSTLGLDYPRRSKFFMKELQHFLLLSQEHKLDPLDVSGSYAGAIGYPQFMPSSYRAYAVDFDGSGQSDLYNSMVDAIGSVANYYSRHHWKMGQPVGVPATLTKDSANKMATKALKTNKTAGKLKKSGVHFDSEVASKTPAALLKLEGEAGPEYRVVFKNFFVITRYNTSQLYAMAIQLLSEKIRKQYQGGECIQSDLC